MVVLGISKNLRYTWECEVKGKEGFHCLCGGGGGGGGGFEDFKLDKRVHTEEGKRREGFHCYFGGGGETYTQATTRRGTSAK